MSAENSTPAPEYQPAPADPDLADPVDEAVAFLLAQFEDPANSPTAREAESGRQIVRLWEENRKRERANAERQLRVYQTPGSDAQDVNELARELNELKQQAAVLRGRRYALLEVLQVLVLQYVDRDGHQKLWWL